jgi:hypothetical protein
VNLLDAWPGAAVGGGSQFPHEAGVDAASALVEFVTARVPRARLVLLGRRVARAFGVGEDRPWFEWSGLTWKSAALGPTGANPRGLLEVVVFPHPSSTSHFWNERANVDAARRFLLSLVRPPATEP